MPEAYTTLGQSTLNGAYTAGSGTMTVTSASSFPTTPTFRVAYVAGGASQIIWKVTAVAGAVFTVTVESGSDANVSNGASIVEVLTAAALDQIRSDQSQYGTRANLPSTTGQKTGNVYRCSDSPYEFVFSGGVWVPLVNGNVMTEPVSGTPAFSWLNQGGATESGTNGGLILTAPAGAGDALRVRYIAQPTRPYTITAAFRANISSDQNYHAGLCWYDSGSGKLTSWEVINNTGASGINIGVINWNSTTSFNGAPHGAANFSWGDLIWLRMTDDGTNFTYYISSDGINFIQWYQTARTAFLTPGNVGYFLSCNNAFTTSSGLWLLSWKQT